MAFGLGPEIAVTLAGLAAAVRPEPHLPGDLIALRNFMDPRLDLSFGRLDWPEVENADFTAIDEDGVKIHGPRGGRHAARL